MAVGDLESREEIQDAERACMPVAVHQVVVPMTVSKRAAPPRSGRLASGNVVQHRDQLWKLEFACTKKLLPS